ncbi:ankyrin repeat domain-containing protein 27 isoform X3 [Syngnathoides biaculeatus]|uniref:ankyrin repeat domain-containing protein 27 isoform X3 n=1 Tax=Syngnathoides biaculeatus TaxID=300417 RepID=UPI002ADE7286|nr:ankyrin repeat domain-containing protein 27 isoform X3 [Syngnathoides biaculeatus]
MATYDENIATNPFFVALEKLRPDLCDRVARLHGVVLVPCCGSLDGRMVSELHFDSYVLQPADDAYRTADGREVRIEDGRVLPEPGRRPPVSVPILFEETFYNAREESYRILCISGPVEAATGVPARAPEAAYRLGNLEEVKEFLGPHCHKLDKVIVNFCQAFDEHDRKGLRHHITMRDRCHEPDDAFAVTGLGPRPVYAVSSVCAARRSPEGSGRAGGPNESTETSGGGLRPSRDPRSDLQPGGNAGSQPGCRLQQDDQESSRAAAQRRRRQSALQHQLVSRQTGAESTQPADVAPAQAALPAQSGLGRHPHALLRRVSGVRRRPAVGHPLPAGQDGNPQLDGQPELHEELLLQSVQQRRAELLPEHFGGGRPGCAEVKVMVELASASAAPISRLFEHIADGDETATERLLSEGEKREVALRPCHPLCACDLCDRRLSGKPGVTARCRDQRGYTPLHVAAVCGQAQLIDLLVSKGASVNATDCHALTPMHLACRKGHQGVTLLLLHYKADADAQDHNGNAPLHLACTYGHEDCVKALVYYDSQTCRLDLRNDKGDAPLHLASRWGYEGIVRVLLENGADVHALNDSGRTPAHCALNSKVLTLLRSTQTERRRPTGGGVHTSDRSARRTSTSSASSSSSSSAAASERQPDRASARHRQVEKLLRAVADADVQMVRYLLEWAEEDEAADASSSSSSPLCHPLCQCASCAPAHKAGAVACGALSVTSANVDGVTPLHVSCTYGHAQLTALLVRRGADVNARTDRKATPLHLASRNGHLQVVKFLLECNAKLNKKDRYGNTALIHACLHGNVDTAAALVQSEALVNVRNAQGNTALHCAVRAGHRPLVDVLLSAGASPHLRDKKHRTPLDAAYQRGGKNVEIVRSLQKAAGLSPDDGPIKLLSVPRGTLAHSLVQHLRLGDHARPKTAAGRIPPEVKKSGRGPTRRSAAPGQASPDARRRRPPRRKTADAIGASAAGRRGRGPDSGEEAPETPIEARVETRCRHDDGGGAALTTSSVASRRRTPERPCRDDASRADAAAVRHPPVSSDTSDINLTDLSLRDAVLSDVTPDSEDATLQ